MCHIQWNRGRSTIREREREGATVRKIRKKGVPIQTNFVPEGNSAVTDVLLCLVNGTRPGIFEQTGGLQPAGLGG